MCERLCVCVCGACHSLCTWTGRSAASCAADPGASQICPSVKEEQRGLTHITSSVCSASQTHTAHAGTAGVMAPRCVQPGRRKQQLGGATVQRRLCECSHKQTKLLCFLFPDFFKPLEAIRRNSDCERCALCRRKVIFFGHTLGNSAAARLCPAVAFASFHKI